MTKKPKEKIVDIDAADAGNELAALEYVEDIYKFYKLVEVHFSPLQFEFILQFKFNSDDLVLVMKNQWFI